MYFLFLWKIVFGSKIQCFQKFEFWKNVVCINLAFWKLVLQFLALNEHFANVAFIKKKSKFNCALYFCFAFSKHIFIFLLKFQYCIYKFTSLVINLFSIIFWLKNEIFTHVSLLRIWLENIVFGLFQKEFPHFCLIFFNFQNLFSICFKFSTENHNLQHKTLQKLPH